MTVFGIINDATIGQFFDFYLIKLFHIILISNFYDYYFIKFPP